MQLNVMPPVVHRRRVDFNAQANLVSINDKVSASDEQPRTITLQWHFPKDKTISIDGNQVVVTSPSGNRLQIDFEGDIPDNLSVVTGRKEDRVFSCISYKTNQLEPSQLLRVMFKERVGLEVTTRFAFALAENHIAPEPEYITIPVQPLAALLTSWKEREPVPHSVMLGSSPAYLDLAKMHREQGLGHVSLLVNDAHTCQAAQTRLNEHYLTTWLTCRSLKLASVPPITIDKAALQGLEGIGLLVVTANGFTAKRQVTTLLTMLPPLFKRMNKSGQVWVSNALPNSLKSLCTTWARQHGFMITFVIGLEEMAENKNE